MVLQAGLKEDKNIMAEYTQIFTSIGSTALTSVYYIFIILLWAGIIGGGVFAFWYLRQYKYRVKIRETVNGRVTIRNTRAREVKENGQHYWKLLYRGEKIPIAPTQAIDIDHKGRKEAQCYRTEEGEYQWITDTGYNPENNKSFEILDTNQRLMLIEGIEEANSRKKLTFMEVLPAVTSAISLVVILVVLFAFWGKITEPMVTVSAQNADTSQKMQLAINKFTEFCGNKQYSTLENSPGGEVLGSPPN